MAGEEVPLAQIICRVVDKEVEGHEPAGDGFLVPTPEDGKLCHTILPACQFNLWPRCSFTVGRDTDSQTNCICIDHYYVSRTHFEIYSVVYEEYDLSKQQPMIYVHDRQSLSGTTVNCRSIGSKAIGASPGYLLSHGDVIRIEPYWEFEIKIPQNTNWGSPLKGIQYLESKIFCDRYLITDRILGNGNYCTIRLAIDAKDGRQLACKISNVDLGRTNPIKHDLIQSIGREADILGKIRHPNLLTLEHAFRSKHTIYIFTELATGGDLFSMYENHDGVLSEVQTKFVMHQVVRGVEYLHKHGLAHRDLKPENIFFSSGSDFKSRVIVGDLGGAKGTSWGRMKTNVGTDLYLAPEMHFGHLSYTKRIDIWSIGIIALVLMASNAKDQLFRLKTMNQESIDEALRSIFTRPSLTNTSIGKEGQDFIRGCLKVDAGQRMTASQAKKHCWFRLPKSTLEEWTKLRNNSWKPSHRTPPPVEELPDVQCISENLHLDLVNTKVYSNRFTTSVKRKHKHDQTDSDSDGASPYFPTSTAASKASEKSKTLPEETREESKQQSGSTSTTKKTKAKKSKGGPK